MLAFRSLGASIRKASPWLARAARSALLLGLVSSLSACIVLPPRHGGHYHDRGRGYDGRGYGPARGAGLVTGGVIGAVVGHEMGRGSDPVLGAAVGAVAGAVIGNEIERSQGRR